MRRAGSGLAMLVGGAGCLLAELLWVSGEGEESFGLPAPAARALVFLVGLTGLVLIYGGYRLLRRR